MNSIINPHAISIIRDQVEECLKKDEYSFEDMIFIYEKSREVLFLYNALPENKLPLEDMMFWYGNILDMKEFVLTYESAVQQDAELVMDIIEYTENEKSRPDLHQATGFMASFDSKASAQKVLNVIRILLDVYAEKGVQSTEYRMWLFYYKHIARFLDIPPRGYAKEDLKRMTVEEAEFFLEEVKGRMIEEINSLPTAAWLARVYIDLYNAIPVLRTAEKRAS